jgi:hypothetical protein
VLDLPAGLSGSGDCERLDYVSCDAAGHVTELDLSGLGLAGNLPASMAVLTKLKRLYLNDNRLEGEGLTSPKETEENMRSVNQTRARPEPRRQPPARIRTFDHNSEPLGRQTRR